MIDSFYRDNEVSEDWQEMYEIECNRLKSRYEQEKSNLLSNHGVGKWVFLVGDITGVCDDEMDTFEKGLQKARELNCPCPLILQIGVI
jgi:hypothetical protein